MELNFEEITKKAGEIEAQRKEKTADFLKDYKEKNAKKDQAFQSIIDRCGEKIRADRMEQMERDKAEAEEKARAEVMKNYGESDLKNAFIKMAQSLNAKAEPKLEEKMQALDEKARNERYLEEWRQRQAQAKEEEE